MSWLPPIIVIGVFLARLAELSFRFPAERGQIEARHTLHALTVVGALTVIAALAEYFLLQLSYSWILMAVGAVLAIGAFALRAASRRALGKMWSTHVEIRQSHVLVRHGPYRFVRHPIYVAAILELSAIPVTLGTWRTGIVALVIYVIALATRVHAEEVAMERQLGAQWREYCQRTGAFFPRW